MSGRSQCCCLATLTATDEPKSYGLLEGDGYKHGTVRHPIKNWKYIRPADGRGT